MATNTTNYNFKKPDESDFYSVQDQNNNWDKADAALKDLDTPTFEDYSGSTTVPDAATAINNIKSKGKLSTIVSNVKAAFKGACLIGQIVNNCVTNNAKLPLSAAQGKALMDLYTQLNSDLGEKITVTGLGTDIVGIRLKLAANYDLIINYGTINAEYLSPGVLYKNIVFPLSFNDTGAYTISVTPAQVSNKVVAGLYTNRAKAGFTVLATHPDFVQGTTLQCGFICIGYAPK